MKKLVMLLIFLALILFFAHIGIEKYFFPKLIERLEEAVAENTPYQIEIKKASLRFTNILIPELEVTRQGRSLTLNELHINFSLLPLLKKEVILQGSGILSREEKKLRFRIEDFLYQLKANSLSAQIYLPSQSLKSYLEIALYWLGMELPILQLREGNSDLRIEAKRDETLKLNLAFQSSQINFELEGKKVVLESLNGNYRILNRTPRLELFGKGLSLFDPAGKLILKEGEFILESNLERIKISKLKIKTQEILWEGNLSLEELKESPTLFFNLESELCSLKGKIKKEENLVSFSYQLAKAQDILEGEGNYDLKAGYLETEGKGKTSISNLILYFKTKLPEELKGLEGNLDFQRYLLEYTPGENIFKLELEIKTSPIKLGGYPIARRGRIRMKAENKEIALEELSFWDEDGQVKLSGELNLNSKIPLRLKIDIVNYDLRKLYQPFTGNDIGDALFSLQGYLSGEVRELSSLKGMSIWKFREGRIGRLKFLSQIATLFQRPELREIRFSSGQGRVEVKGEKIILSQTILYSDLLNLFVSGSIGFGGELDVTLITEFKKEKALFEPDSPFKKLGDILFKGVEELFYKIIISGDVKNPKYTIVPASVDRILRELFR